MIKLTFIELLDFCQVNEIGLNTDLINNYAPQGHVVAVSTMLITLTNTPQQCHCAILKWSSCQTYYAAGTLDITWRIDILHIATVLKPQVYLMESSRMSWIKVCANMCQTVFPWNWTETKLLSIVGFFIFYLLPHGHVQVGSKTACVIGTTQGQPRAQSDFEVGQYYNQSATARH